MSVRFIPVLLFLLASPQALAADLPADEAPLQGAWTAVSAQRDGAAANELVGHRIEFEGDRFEISKAGAVIFAGGFSVNPGATPAQIDFKVEEGEAKAQDWAGIYRIDGGALTICDNAPKPDALRQQSFDAPKGSGYVCLTFQR